MQVWSRAGELGTTASSKVWIVMRTSTSVISACFHRSTVWVFRLDRCSISALSKLGIAVHRRRCKKLDRWRNVHMYRVYSVPCTCKHDVSAVSEERCCTCGDAENCHAPACTLGSTLIAYPVQFQFLHIQVIDIRYPIHRVPLDRVPGAMVEISDDSRPGVVDVSTTRHSPLRQG